ncbi:YjfB family protein [Solibacillus sp. FSL H8-0538]|uniref:YjfB family protein n=1 Tax=Solibacillus sp. FSL H8-0538 TaxID=2921400 RepID=UPI0030F60CDA
MDIAALSISLHQEQLMQNVSLTIVKQVVEFQQQSSAQIVEMIDAPHPTAGQMVDLST